MFDTKLYKSDVCEDVETTRALPIKLQKEKCSSFLNNFIKEKQNQHDDILKRLKKEVETINLSAEEELNRSIKVLQDELELIKNEVDYFKLADINDLIQWKTFSEKISKRQSRIRFLVEEFSDDLVSLENNRVENVKKSLSACKEEAMQLRFVSFLKVEQIFYDEITDVNTKTLCNLQRHEDVKLRFQCEAQEVIKKYDEVLTDQARHFSKREGQRLWNKVQAMGNKRIAEKAIMDLTEDCFKTSKKCFTKNDLEEHLFEFNKLLQLPEEYGIPEEFWEELSQKLCTDLSILDICKNIGNIFETTIKRVNSGFENDLQILFTTTSENIKKLLNNLSGTDTLDLETLQDKYNAELKDMLLKKEEIIDRLRKKIVCVHDVSKELLSIWINHFTRVNHVKKKFESLLKPTNNTKATKLEKDIDSKIKGIREAKDLDKLNVLSNSLNAAICDSDSVWEKDQSALLKMIYDTQLKEFGELIQQKQLDIQRFLVKNSKKDWFTGSNFGELPSDGNNTESNFSVNFDGYIYAVDNAVLHLFTTMDMYVPSCEKIVQLELGSWLDEFINEVSNDHQFQCTNKRVKYLKALKEAKNKRFGELNIHAERLLSHVEAVNNNITKLAHLYEEVMTNQQLLLSSFHDKMLYLTNSSSFASSPPPVSDLSELKLEWNGLSEALEKNILEAKMHAEKTFSAIKTSNGSFLKTAKNFKNGGNYSPEELKILSKEIKQLEKVCTTQTKVLSNNYDKLHKGISNKLLDAAVQKLQNHLDNEVIDKKFVESINTVRLRLRFEVGQLRNKGRQIDTYIAHLNSLNEIDGNLFENIIKTCDSRYDHLHCSFPLECTKNKSSNSKKADTFNDVGKNALFENCFGKSADQENTFLICIKNLLQTKYYSMVQKVEESFFVKDLDAKNESKPGISKKKEAKQNVVSQELSNRIEQVNSTLQSYNLECEKIWIQQAREFMSQVASLRIIVQRLGKEDLERAHGIYLKNLLDLQQNHNIAFSKETNQEMSKRTKIQMSIKIPLGHPTYQHKLDDLYNEAKSICETQGQSCRKLVASFKDALQASHEQYVEQIKILKHRLEDTQMVLDNTVTHYSDLFHKVNEAQLSIKPSISEENSGSEDELEADVVGVVIQEEPPLYPSSIWSDDEEQDLLLRKSLVRNASTSTIKSKSSERESSVTIKCLATVNIKQSAEQIQKLFNEAMISLNEFEKSLTFWLNSLRFEIKQAKLVYKPLCE